MLAEERNFCKRSGFSMFCFFTLGLLGYGVCEELNMGHDINFGAGKPYSYTTNTIFIPDRGKTFPEGQISKFSYYSLAGSSNFRYFKILILDKINLNSYSIYSTSGWIYVPNSNITELRHITFDRTIEVRKGSVLGLHFTAEVFIAHTYPFRLGSQFWEDEKQTKCFTNGTLEIYHEPEKTEYHVNDTFSPSAKLASCALFSYYAYIAVNDKYEEDGTATSTDANTNSTTEDWNYDQYDLDSELEVWHISLVVFGCIIVIIFLIIICCCCCKKKKDGVAPSGNNTISSSDKPETEPKKCEPSRPPARLEPIAPGRKPKLPPAGSQAGPPAGGAGSVYPSAPPPPLPPVRGQGHGAAYPRGPPPPYGVPPSGPPGPPPGIYDPSSGQAGNRNSGELAVISKWKSTIPGPAVYNDLRY